ncbi:hypothetical protein EDB81DRAFT_434563 [Dactylonectria macrodidyma]|uniref:Uncharacterized protein n=1 Tax=Dactylonectria macrodidyma TaxID=307937 RepID=A0A9P9F5W8_9HYPO|nr:hypothetical protein EDB81DRAFT_434563 [Dactylonectria macrodidyma]
MANQSRKTSISWLFLRCAPFLFLTLYGQNLLRTRAYSVRDIVGKLTFYGFALLLLDIVTYLVHGERGLDLTWLVTYRLQLVGLLRLPMLRPLPPRQGSSPGPRYGARSIPTSIFSASLTGRCRHRITPRHPTTPA